MYLTRKILNFDEKWKVKVKSLSHVWLFATPWTVVYQAPLSMKFSRQEYWSWLPFPSPGDLPDPGIEPSCLLSPVLAGGFSTIVPLGNSIRVRVFEYGCLYFYPKWKKREVTQPCPTLCNPMDCSLLGSSVHGIFQAIVLEWIAISFSRGSSQPRDWTQVSRIVDRHFTVWATREVLKLCHLK